MAPRRQLTDPGTGAPAQRGRRAAVLQLLREADTPMSAADVSERVGAHLNTARFHLDALVADGLADRATAPRDEPGRPKVVYSAAAAQGPDGSRSFRLLAEMLLGVVTTSVEDPVAAATRAGHQWGSYLTDTPAPTELIGAAEGERRLVATLEDTGFVTDTDPGTAPDTDPEPGSGGRAPGERGSGEPAAAGSGQDRELRLHHCPFREVAQRRPDIVCAIHLGLMRGTVETLGAPLTVENLRPFVTPHLCVATLRRTGTG